MTNSIFSTVDHLTTRFKLVDSLINTIATRLLPQHKASGFDCGWPYYFCGYACGDYCLPTSDLRYSTVAQCCFKYDGATYMESYRVGCDNCG